MKALAVTGRASDMVVVLKQELKTRRLTYVHVAEALGLSESSVKRNLARPGTLKLSHVEKLASLLEIDMPELMSRVASLNADRR